ncbi:MAG TPA: hypothetical protein VII06_18320 [Chloroflexota bacterium]|jgi:hypothetical protein
MIPIGRLARAVWLVSLALSVLTPAIASAHEHRTVAGDYGFMLGFRQEPPYAGLSNGVDLCVTRADNDAPVEQVDRTLHVEVTMGAESLPLPLEPRFGSAGCYDGRFVPTRPGTYYFLITGFVEGRPVDEVFESGPGRFDDVVSAGSIQFPDKVPSGTDLRDAVRAAESQAVRATTFALAGLGCGLGGFLLAIWALASGRHPAHASASNLRGARAPRPREQH